MDIRGEPSPPSRIWHPPPVPDGATEPGYPAAPGRSPDRADADTTPAAQATRPFQQIAAQRFCKTPACSHTVPTWHRRGARHAARLWRRGAQTHPAAGVRRREAIAPHAQRTGVKRAPKARSRPAVSRVSSTAPLPASSGRHRLSRSEPLPAVYLTNYEYSTAKSLNHPPSPAPWERLSYLPG